MQILSEQSQRSIVQAIQKAEERTTGEIKVHIEEHCPVNDVSARAVEVFNYLALDKTALRNGVLLYLAYGDNQFAILGDAGINQKVGQQFWDSTKTIMQQNFKNKNFELGFIKAIQEVGEKLRLHFPADGKNENEISDEISIG